ncbi:FAD-dependent oxidoreductase, partial [Gammaproteobacteria bacterium]|nr:FAD-dependent oxidoreductase [Gammaproteobacteria bacterium]
IENYPQSIKITDFIIPIYKDKSKNINYVYLGAKLYQFLSGRNSLGKSTKINKQQLLDKKLGLIEDNLLGAVTYKDAIMDDKAIVRDLKNELLHKRVLINEFDEVVSVSKSGALKTKTNKFDYDLIINACGPWARKLIIDSGMETAVKLKGVRGSHLIIDKTIKYPILIQDTKNKRVIFVIPFDDNAILGTTEVDQDIEVEPACSINEERYLINFYNDYFYESIDESNILEKYSGVRPLIYRDKDKSLSSISRESYIEACGKVITLYGGKWTTSNNIGDKIYSKYIRSNKC